MSRRALTIISLAAIVPIGFESKFYGGPAHVWVNDSLGGAFYDMFWCLAAFFAFPGGRPLVIAAVVLASTCALEFMQLWHPPFLEYLRNCFIGSDDPGDDLRMVRLPLLFRRERRRLAMADCRPQGSQDITDEPSSGRPIKLRSRRFGLKLCNKEGER